MSEIRKLLATYWCHPDMVEDIDGCDDGAYVITKQEMLELIDLIRSNNKSVADYLKANEKILTKTKAKMVTVESLKQFAGISEQSEE